MLPEYLDAAHKFRREVLRIINDVSPILNVAVCEVDVELDEENFPFTKISLGLKDPPTSRGSWPHNEYRAIREQAYDLARQFDLPVPIVFTTFALSTKPRISMSREEVDAQLRKMADG